MGQLCSKEAGFGLSELEDSNLRPRTRNPQRQGTGSAPHVLNHKPAARPPRHDSAGSVGDSASSLHGQPFALWVEQESRELGMRMDQFLLDSLATSDEIQVAAPASSTGASQGPTASSNSNSSSSVSRSMPPSTLPPMFPNMATAPLQPRDAFANGPPLPACGPERMAVTTALNDLRITRNDEVESMLRLLCNVFEVETAGVTLLTGECVWAPYVCGAMTTGLRPARWGFCGWAFLNANHELLVVEDCTADARFSSNLFVTGPPALRFYVAAPLISSDGHRLGTLCIFGQEPRKFDATRAQLLANLSELLVRQFERHWVMQVKEQQEGRHLQRSLAVYDSACLVVDVSTSAWRILHMNPPAIDQLGVEWEPCGDYLADHPGGKVMRKPWGGMPFEEVFEYPQCAAEWVSGSWEFVLRGVRGAAGNPQMQDKVFDLHFRLAISDGLDHEQPFDVGVPSWLPMDSDNFGRSYFFVRLQEATATEAAAAGGNSPAPLVVQRRAISTGGAWPGSGGRNSSDSSTSDSSSSSSSSSSNSRGVRAQSTGGAPGNSSSGGARWLSRLHGSGGSSSSSSNSSGSTNSGSMLICDSVWLPRGPEGPLGCPLEGLVLGPLVGKGSYGRVYRGIFRGTPVAVKIINDTGSMRRDKAGQPLEAALTSGMAHLGVMRTLAWAYKETVAEGRRVSASGKAEGSRLSAGGVPADAEGRRMSSGGRAGSAGAAGSAPSSGIVSSSGNVAGASGAAGPGSGCGAAGGSRLRRSSGGASGSGGKSCWMVMEYCDMGCVADAVLKGWFRTSRKPDEGATDLTTVVITAYEIASAMQYLHSKGVVHGDLSGGNIMLKASGIYKHGFVARVGDFGLAREASAGPSKAKKNVYGTVTHMPPEVLMDGGVTKAADVYSFGVLLWEMLTGCWAWAGLRHAQIICQVALLKRSLAIPPGLPPPIEALLTSCLAPSASERPCFTEIVGVLSDWLQAAWGAEPGARVYAHSDDGE